MTSSIIAIAISALSVLSSNTKPVNNKNFLIHGVVVEVDLQDPDEKVSKDTQIIVYQDGEIYVAFNTDDKGKYEFNLPIAHTYKVVYGGTKFVNKSIYIDAENLPRKKYGHNVELDMGLFHDYEGVDFSFLDEPMAQIAYNDEYNKLLFDEKYSMQKWKEMRKCMKQVQKIK